MKFQNPGGPKLLSFSELVEHQLGGNSCYTLYNVKENAYTDWHLVQEILGYSNDEFTVVAVNRSDKEPGGLIYEKHLEHKKRYSDIVFKILEDDNVNFKVRMDYYSVCFRIKHKLGHYLPVRRKSYVFRVEDDQMVERIDKWDLLTRYKASHVYPEIYMTDLPLSEELNERLYFENMKKLNLKISNRHLKALHLKSESLSNIKIAKTWSPDNHDFSPRTVEKYFTEVSNILREHFRDYPIGAHGIEKLAKTYGLLPIPESLLKKDSM